MELTKGICSVPDCGGILRARGWCNRHYSLWSKGKDFSSKPRAKKGSGGLSNGYRIYRVNGVAVAAHTLIVQKVLNRKLREHECVHHVNEIRDDNRNENLVICPNNAYHFLLHVRQRALDACGNANWLKCVHCKQWSSPDNIITYKTLCRGRRTGVFSEHRECRDIKNRKRDRRKIKYGIEVLRPEGS